MEELCALAPGLEENRDVPEPPPHLVSAQTPPSPTVVIAWTAAVTDSPKCSYFCGEATTRNKLLTPCECTELTCTDCLETWFNRN